MGSAVVLYVEMSEVVGVELYWKLIAKMMGVVCKVVAGFNFFIGLFLLDVGNRESNSVDGGTEVLIENVCIKLHVLQTCCFPSNEMSR